jgi:hypothetical protein
MFLLQHMMLLRGETTRRVELADLLGMDLPDEGPVDCPALLMRMAQGKTNRFGRVEYGATVRNRNHQVCAFGALALYFFYRWHVSGEPFPYFTTNRDWFNIKVAKGRRQLDQPMSYAAHNHATDRAFTSLKINISKKTHSGRGSGAQHAELDGATEDQLRRHGRWNTQSMEACYLSSIARVPMLIINGFSGTRGEYWIPRATVCPPLSLQRRIFPEVDVLLEKLEDPQSTSLQHSLAAIGFLRLLVAMRPIILQDAVAFRQDHPDHPLFTNALFSSQEFLVFEEELSHAMTTAEEPRDILLHRALPLVSEQFRQIHRRLSVSERMAMHQRELMSHFNRNMESFNLCIAKVKNSLAEFFTPVPSPTGSSAAASSSSSSPASSSVFSSAAAADSSSTSPSASSSASSSSYGYVAAVAATAAASSSAPTTSSWFTYYEMNRSIATVPDLVREWTVGLGNGRPSIESLNNTYGTRWRRSPRRKLIICIIISTKY